MGFSGQLLPGQRRGSSPAMVAALRVLLWALGYGLVLTSRFSARVRSQITRSLTVEISTDDGVARHWVFDSQRRHVSVSAGRVRTPDFALRFTNSGQALRDLTSPRAGPPRQALPGAYVAHDPAANGVEKITIEPAVRQLDPGWTGAWNSRAKLWIVLGANGEPLREP
jgi:hypothetical protein